MFGSHLIQLLPEFLEVRLPFLEIQDQEVAVTGHDHRSAQTWLAGGACCHTKV